MMKVGNFANISYDFSTIERAVRTSGCSHTSPTELLIDEWGTMGQFRPTVEDLLGTLVDFLDHLHFNKPQF